MNRSIMIEKVFTIITGKNICGFTPDEISDEYGFASVDEMHETLKLATFQTEMDDSIPYKEVKVFADAAANMFDICQNYRKLMIEHDSKKIIPDAFPAFIDYLRLQLGARDFYIKTQSELPKLKYDCVQLFTASKLEYQSREDFISAVDTGIIIPLHTFLAPSCDEVTFAVIVLGYAHLLDSLASHNWHYGKKITYDEWHQTKNSTELSGDDVIHLLHVKEYQAVPLQQPKITSYELVSDEKNIVAHTVHYDGDDASNSYEYSNFAVALEDYLHQTSLFMLLSRLLVSTEAVPE